MKPDGTYEKAYGWGNSSYTFYVPQDRYIRVMFNYRGDAGTISPDDIKIKSYPLSLAKFMALLKSIIPIIVPDSEITRTLFLL